jgi:hypothetical protein
VVPQELLERLPGRLQRQRDEMDVRGLAREKDRQLVYKVTGGRRLPLAVRGIAALGQVRRRHPEALREQRDLVNSVANQSTPGCAMTKSNSISLRPIAARLVWRRFRLSSCCNAR